MVLPLLQVFKKTNAEDRMVQDNYLQYQHMGVSSTGKVGTMPYTGDASCRVRILALLFLEYQRKY